MAWSSDLAGRAFAIVVHGDTQGTEPLRNALHNWLVEMSLEPAGQAASLDRYISYYRPYATSHDDLDGDPAVFIETRNAMRALLDRVHQRRSGLELSQPALDDPRPK